MLNFLYKNGKLIDVSYEYRAEAMTRNDMPTIESAQIVAHDASALTGKLYIAVDKGPHTWPRYDVIEAPVVGSAVSRAFNGDYYPAGTIVSVSESLRVVKTSDGTTFYRHQNSATWVAGRTWAMVSGHITERNPHF